MSEILLDTGQPFVHRGLVDSDGRTGNGLLYREAIDENKAQHFGSRGIVEAIEGVKVRDHDEMVRLYKSEPHHRATSTGAMPGLNRMDKWVTP
jgi:hypothetical protein